MACGALEDCVGGDRVVHDHGRPAGGVSLGADDGAPLRLGAFFQHLEEHFHLRLVGDRVQQEIVKDQQVELHEEADPLPVFGEVGVLLGGHGLEQFGAMGVERPVAPACLDRQGLCEVGLAAVRGAEDAHVQAVPHEVEGPERLRDPHGKI